MTTDNDLQAEINRLAKRLDRERRARLEAELLAEKETRALYERGRELELLHRITDAANGATSIPVAIQTTLDEICAYTGWPVGHAYFVDQGPDVLVSSKIWHLDHPERFGNFRAVSEARRFGVGEGLPGAVLQSGEPLWIPDVQGTLNFPRTRESADIGVVAAFAFPVLAGSTVMAVLEFFSGERVEKEETWLKIARQTGVQLGRIFERQQAAAELEKASRDMLDLSRSAGMAEVATGVLHNVGNVLNSVSVSATILSDRLKNSKLANLRRAADMLKEKNDDLVGFLTTDPKGKLLPAYLGQAAGQLEQDQLALIAEADCLNENIEHIKGVVSMQQNYANVSGLAESLDPVGLVEDALRMKGSALVRHRIEIRREFAPGTPKVYADRHQVMQILINLLRNSKQAMEARASGKLIVVQVGPCGETQVAISVIDTGVGIPRENLNQVFNYGFTTKRDGHGFGLHSGANAAKEMGGRLSVDSEGEGRGATFTLELPTAKPDNSLKSA